MTSYVAAKLHSGAVEHVREDASVLARWQASVSRSFVPLTVEADPRSSFRARLTGRVCERVFFSTVSATAHTVHRTITSIDESRDEYLKLMLLTSGNAAILQDGRETRIGPRDIVLYDTTRAYSLDFSGRMSAVIVMFPHSLIAMDRRVLRHLTAVRLTKGTFARSVGLFLGELASGLDGLDAKVASRATHNALDLIQTMVGYELSETRTDDPASDVMIRIDDYINAHLRIRGLTPGMVAAAHFVSTRHLHEMFHRRGTTVSRVIRERKLERARRDLLDPARANESIGSIAQSWGFSDVAQFSRSFRAYAGVSPSECRSTANKGRREVQQGADSMPRWVGPAGAIRTTRTDPDTEGRSRDNSFLGRDNSFSGRAPKS